MRPTSPLNDALLNPTSPLNDALLNPTNIEAQYPTRENHQALYNLLKADNTLTFKEKSEKLMAHAIRIPGQVLPDDVNTVLRNIYTGIATFAVGVMEPLYSVFQFTSSLQTFLSYNVPLAAAIPVDLIGTVGDYVANISAVLPADDAVEALFTTNEPLRPWFGNTENLIKFISFVFSYPFGAAMGALPLLAWLPDDLAPAVYGTLATLFLGINVVPGMVYYYSFNNGPIYNQLKTLQLWLDAPDRTINKALLVEFCITALSVVGYRSTTFALSAGTLASLFAKGYILPATFMVLVGTAVNVAGSRLKTPGMNLLSSDYNLIPADKLAAATRKFQQEGMKSLKNGLIALTGLIRALGAGLLAKSMVGKENPLIQFITLALTTLIMGGISLYAQYITSINNLAIKAMTDEDPEALKIAARELQGDNIVTESAQELPTLDTQRLQTGKEKLEALAKTFINTYGLATTIMVAAGLGQAIRLSSFLGFLPRVAGFLNLEVSLEQEIAACLFLAPTNIINQYEMFANNMQNYITMKMAECYVSYTLSESELAFGAWFRANRDQWLALYNTAGCDFALEDIDLATAKRNEDLNVAGLDRRPSNTSNSSGATQFSGDGVRLVDHYADIENGHGVTDGLDYEGYSSDDDGEKKVSTNPMQAGHTLSSTGNSTLRQRRVDGNSLSSEASYRDQERSNSMEHHG